jgi:ring-1,2-phenylacetyl-CoA epoxidase subunit PaaD
MGLPRRDLLAREGVTTPCPYCGAEETERAAAFGSFHMSETYFCKKCGSPFSRIKWQERKPGPR